MIFFLLLPPQLLVQLADPRGGCPDPGIHVPFLHCRQPFLSTGQRQAGVPHAEGNEQDPDQQERHLSSVPLPRVQNDIVRKPPHSNVLTRPFIPRCEPASVFLSSSEPWMFFLWDSVTESGCGIVSQSMPVVLLLLLSMSGAFPSSDWFTVCLYDYCPYSNAFFGVVKP